MKHHIQKIVISFLIFLHFSCISSQDSKPQSSVDPSIATWTLISTNSPNFRDAYAMAYDILNKKIVAYGGRTGFPDANNVNETWAFDYELKTWSNLEPINSPVWRSSHTMIYNSVRNKILMFGGSDFNQVFNDLWEFSIDQNTWVELLSDTSPDARQMHGMVYVPNQDIMLLFGGRRLNGGASFNDLWKYSFATNAWQELNATNSPPVQDHVALTYDLVNQKVIMYADVENNNPPATWEYNLTDNSWRNLNSKNTPSANHSKLVYDAHNNKSVLFAGTSTWSFQFNENSWTNITPNVFPEIEFTSHPLIEHDGMVYLNNKNVFIQYGGCCSNATLELILNK